jgi:hypothetical protein
MTELVFCHGLQKDLMVEGRMIEANDKKKRKKYDLGLDNEEEEEPHGLAAWIIKEIMTTDDGSERVTFYGMRKLVEGLTKKEVDGDECVVYTETRSSHDATPVKNLVVIKLLDSDNVWQRLVYLCEADSKRWPFERI